MRREGNTRRGGGGGGGSVGDGHHGAVTVTVIIFVPLCLLQDPVPRHICTIILPANYTPRKT
jgi:hypothetical protein